MVKSTIRFKEYNKLRTYLIKYRDRIVDQLDNFEEIPEGDMHRISIYGQLVGEKFTIESVLREMDVLFEVPKHLSSKTMSDIEILEE